jgi:hypothetical protein
VDQLQPVLESEEFLKIVRNCDYKIPKFLLIGLSFSAVLICFD